MRSVPKTDYHKNLICEENTNKPQKRVFTVLTANRSLSLCSFHSHFLPQKLNKGYTYNIDFDQSSLDCFSISKL